MRMFALDSDPEERSWLERWRGRVNCPPPELLLPALEGSLPSERTAAAVRAHIERCPLCAELADVLREAAESPTSDEAARISARIRRPTGAYRRLRPLASAAAAAVFIVAGAVYLTQRTQPQEPLPAPAATPARGEAPRPSPVLPLAAPAIQLPPESLTLRSRSPDTYAVALETALEPFVEGDYGQAGARLERVAREHPNRAHAEFYFGVARLMQGRAADAVPLLERARELAGPESSLYPEATWYLAVALEHSGRADSAVAPLGALCGGGSTRDVQACEGLLRLQVR